jgi:NAD binding domain of 6-phosphogluconate dehydrogenase
MRFTMAVIGAGRMGSVIARQIPENTNKIIIDIDLKRARLLAEKIGGVCSDSLESTRAAKLVAVVLPTSAVNETINKLLSILEKDSIILNMATTAQVEASLHKKNTGVSIIDAKIIGHAISNAKGEPGIIVVKCNDNVKFELIKDHLPGFTEVVQGDSELVPQINKLAAAEGIRAAVTIRKRLRKLAVPESWINVALRTVCAGTVKAFVDNDLGHFALELAKKIEEEV